MSDSRAAVSRLGILALLLVCTAGCARESNGGRYFTNRYYDFRDLTHMAIGGTSANSFTGIFPPSLGAYVQVTDLLKLGAITHNGATMEVDHRGSGAYLEQRTRLGLLTWEGIYLRQYYDSASYTNYFKGGNTLWRKRMHQPENYWLGAPPKDYHYDHWDSDLQYSCGPLMHNGWNHILNSQAELALCDPIFTKLGFTLRLGLDVSEIGDFLTGWFGLDMYGDDMTPAEYAEFLRYPEPRAVSAPTPEVTVAVPLPVPTPAPAREIVVREIPSDVLFDPGSSTLRPDGRRMLIEVASELKTQYPNAKIIVEGHTDSRPIVVTRDKWRTNWDLGAGRALEVLHYLMREGGIPDARFDHARTYSDHEPKATNATPEGRQQNRRAVIYVIASE